jgi:hypothetical protein
MIVLAINASIVQNLVEGEPDLTGSSSLSAYFSMKDAASELIAVL